MPVHNGAAFLERSIGSVRGQTFPDWELLAADDGSTDDSYARLCRFAAAEPRIRPFRLPTGHGNPAAPRNMALRQARGSMITYLDQDDEYDPAYLSHVHGWRDAGEILVFTYDIVAVAVPGQKPALLETWDPAPLRERMMTECIVVPLAVAHRRALLDRVGLFQEGQGFHFEEDLDLWRRMARAGAGFVFLPLKSGRYHVHSNSLSRRRQRAKAGVG
jgi:glycosyltransferase involved in cell wall biosynthesis